MYTNALQLTETVLYVVLLCTASAVLLAGTEKARCRILELVKLISIMLSITVVRT